MAGTFRVCLLCSDASAAEKIGNALEQIEDISVTATCSSYDELRFWLQQEAVQLVAVNLDDPSGEALASIARIANAATGCGIVGISADTSPDNIIRAMREGCSQFVSWPIDVADLRRAIDRVRATLTVVRDSSQRICIVGSAGGAGATTIACNLSHELANVTEQRVSLVDLDLEYGDVACAFDCSPAHSLASVARDGVELDRTMMENALKEVVDGVYLLARPEQIGEAETVTEQGMEHVMSFLAKLFPYVLVDVPRTLGPLTQPALRGADHVLIVTQLGVPFIRNATRVYERLTRIGVEPERIKIVLNRFKAKYERITRDDVEAHFGQPVLAIIPNDYRRAQSAMDFGRPISQGSNGNPARQAIEDLARRLVADATEDAAAADQGPGLFGRPRTSTAQR